jgi:hypothetical protein
VKFWLRDGSFILLAFALWLVSLALPPAAVVQAVSAGATAAPASAASAI